MKKLIIVMAVGIVATQGLAQNGKKNIAPLPPQKEVKDAPPAPPPPPTEAIFVQPPPPPPPPVAPLHRLKNKSTQVVNQKGYIISVQNTNEEPVILLTKKGITQKIRMSVWNAKPEYFENKYGKLPPPPPPPMPAPPIMPAVE